eukprot:TRINITY_DN1234_c0_g1_i18.p1 TRINITY_DN1234_c0_g1~~TRINITY_DN1234_c0_g1_i18.p1  ORF type:complete len:199 (-),score=37.75 TRINITY_DN1234_c0_g1_i18:134-730(-)
MAKSVNFGSEMASSHKFKFEPKIIRTEFSSVPSLIVISNSEHRTFKYMVAVVTFTLILHFNWIRHCVEQNCLLPHRPYQLPSGYCVFTGRPLFMNEYLGPPLEGVHVFVNGPKELKESWNRIVVISSGSVVHQLEHLVGENDRKEIVVTLVPPSKTLISLTNKLQLPLVSVEWLVQTIIQQQFLDVSSSHQFHYRTVE